MPSGFHRDANIHTFHNKVCKNQNTTNFSFLYEKEKKSETKLLSNAIYIDEKDSLFRTDLLRKKFIFDMLNEFGS